MLNTPVAFIIFNRPDLTQRVWTRIAAEQPDKLFIIADGPRDDDERLLTEAARKITESIDWPCNITRIYSDVNLGCKNRIITGLNEVFGQVETAIILEDDCLPHSSFFRFCEELLYKYYNDKTVMHIGGNNFQNGAVIGDGSYYFSIYSHIWGWATWATSWKVFQHNLQKHKELIYSNISSFSRNDEYQIKYWMKILDKTALPTFTAWSYNWLFSIWIHNGKAVIPNCNLVQNIGFGENATHTKGSSSQSILANDVGIVQHPSSLRINSEADDRTFYSIFYHMPKKLTLIRKLQWRLKRILETRING